MCQLLRAGPSGRVTRLLVTFLGSQLDKPRLFLVATNRVHVNIAVIINAIVLYILIFMYLLEIKLLLPLLQPAIVWVHFVYPSVGHNCRRKYRHFYNKSIEKTWTPIFAVPRTFTVCHALVSWQQFPLCPSSARIIHECQGKALSKAVVKIGKRKSAHSHSTALSRVSALENVNIIHLNENKISVDQSVKTKCGTYAKIVKWNCYTPVYELSPFHHRIIIQNIRSLNAHFTDITCDANYKAADLLAFAESRLSHNDDNDDYIFQGFHDNVRNDQEYLHNRRCPHGLVIFVRDSYTVSYVHHFSSDELEYSFLKSKCDSKAAMQVLVLYKSYTCRVDIFRNVLKCMKNLFLWIRSFSYCRWLWYWCVPFSK